MTWGHLGGSWGGFWSNGLSALMCTLLLLPKLRKLTLRVTGQCGQCCWGNMRSKGKHEEAVISVRCLISGRKAAHLVRSKMHREALFLPNRIEPRASDNGKPWLRCGEVGRVLTGVRAESFLRSAWG